MLTPVLQVLARGLEGLAKCIDAYAHRRSTLGQDEADPHRSPLGAVRAQVVRQIEDAQARGAALEVDAVHALAKAAVLEPDAASLAQFLTRSSGLDLMDKLTPTFGDSAKAKQLAMQSLLHVAIVASQERRPSQEEGAAPGSALSARALEDLMDLWLEQPDLPGPSTPGLEAMRQLTRTIRQSCSSDEQARMTRMGLAFAVCGPITMWRWIETRQQQGLPVPGWPQDDALSMQEQKEPGPAHA